MFSIDSALLTGDLLPGFSEICTLETELSSLQRHSEVLKDSAGAKYQVLYACSEQDSSKSSN